MRGIRSLVPALTIVAAAGGVLAVAGSAQTAGGVTGTTSAGAAAPTSARVAGVPLVGSAGVAPTFDPANFAHPQANPYFPLQAGLLTAYRGSEDRVRYRERVRVLHRTRMVAGVRARVVRDVLRRADGSLAERTRDWYAADDDGNVWYLGERTATYDRRGRLQSREGSWEAGVHGAVAGLIMPAAPHATDAYRQEYWRGHAEDQAWIVGVRATVTVPLGTFHHVVRTFEWSRLEPGVVSVKLYARGVGIVREFDVAGGTESFRAVSMRRG